MSKKFLPESTYKVDSTMTYANLIFLHETKTTIAGKVMRINLQNKTFEVDLGGNISGYMSYSDSTLYPIYKENGSLSINVYSLVGKTILVKIVSVEGNNIKLSRKLNMLEAFESLKSETEFSYGTIVGYSHLCAFVDIGGGILGKIYGKHFAPTIFKDITDIGIPVYTNIPVTVLDCDTDNYRFSLSRMAALPPIEETVKENTCVSCKVFNPLGDGLGYYALIDNNICGIIDSPNVKLKYGDEVLAYVKSLSSKGPRLSLVEIF